MLLPGSVGSPLARSAERTLKSLLSHAPPRNTRKSPLFGPAGFVSGELA
jgi:hypothetical protein